MCDTLYFQIFCIFISLFGLCLIWVTCFKKKKKTVPDGTRTGRLLFQIKTKDTSPAQTTYQSSPSHLVFITIRWILVETRRHGKNFHPNDRTDTGVHPANPKTVFFVTLILMITRAPSKINWKHQDSGVEKRFGKLSCNAKKSTETWLNLRKSLQILYPAEGVLLQMASGTRDRMPPGDHRDRRWGAANQG